MDETKSPEKVIKLENASKRFGSVTAVKNISASFSKGINIILGPNGAGKSTLLRCIDGLYKLDHGAINVFGKDPYTANEVKAEMSLLSDNYALYDYLTVSGNLRFFGRLYGMKDDDTLQISKKILGEMDALQYINSKVYTLSRGTKQKIAFCRAVINDPKILLLDEPTAFLDARSSEFVRNFMLRYEKEGRAILFVTQKLDEVTMFNGRIILIRDGSIIKDVTLEALYKSLLRNIAITIRLARPIQLKVAKATPGFESANSQKPTMLKINVRNYKDVNKALEYLIHNGAYVTSTEYIEPLIEKLSISDG